ncbi:hypothetical protein SEPB56_16854, partial [Salmonella enterica subsp. enterica serovar Paratyphi B str. SARA56]
NRKEMEKRRKRVTAGNGLAIQGRKLQRTVDQVLAVMKLAKRQIP